MGEFSPTDAQTEILEILVQLIGFSGVHKRPEQGNAIVLDLLPGAHMSLGLGEFGQPFCVRIETDGRMSRISDTAAGIAERAVVPI